MTVSPELLVARSHDRAPDPRHRGPVDHDLYLTGRPTLRDFLRHVRHSAADPTDEGALTEEWSAAKAVIRRLKEEEAGVANDPPITKLGPEYEPLLDELLRDPLIRNGFNTVPTEVALVELDRLVVYQKHIDLSHAGRLERRLAAAPSDEELFRICLPSHHPQPPVQWSRVHKDKFVFVSPSNDLRFLGVMQLDPDNITAYPPPGDLVGVVGIAVGFGSNFLNAIYAEGRIILRNGSHRAYVLRKLGVARVPCIIQHVASRDELEVVAGSDIRRDPDLYLKHPRPPMLRDYFNPALHRVTRVRRRNHTITVSFDVDENVAPAV